MTTAAQARAEALATGLYPHQIEGVAFLLGRQRSILADDMGLGKTRQSAIAMAEARPRGPYLVICPAAVKTNWSRELLLALPEAETEIVGPAPPPRHQGLRAGLSSTTTSSANIWSR